jgi:hypothetical protein
VARVLVYVAFLDLLLGRVLLSMLGGGPTALRAGAVFVHYLAALLALVTSFLGIHGMLGDARRFGGGARSVVAVTSAAFLPLAALAMATHLPPWLQPHLYSAFVLSLAGLLLASSSASAPQVARTGIFCLAVAPLLYGLGTVGQHYAAALPGWLAVWLDPAAGIGRAAALLGGIPSLMVVRPARFDLRSVASAAVMSIGVAVAVAAIPGLPVVALGLPLPPLRIGQALALISVFLTLLAIGSVRGASQRRRALLRGLALLLCTGYLLDEPAHLLVVHAAFVLLARGVALGAPEPTLWRAFMDAVARRVEAAEPVLITLRGEEVSRMRVEEGPVDVRVVRRGDDIAQIDVTIGNPPRSAPALSALHRQACQPRGARLPEAEGSVSAAGQADFDRAVALRGDGAAGVLDNELRDLLLALPPGALAVWPGEGARWRSFPARTTAPDRPVAVTEIGGAQEAPAVEDLVGVVQVLRQVARRAGIRC